MFKKKKKKSCFNPGVGKIFLKPIVAHWSTSLPTPALTGQDNVTETQEAERSLYQDCIDGDDKRKER